MTIRELLNRLNEDKVDFADWEVYTACGAYADDFLSDSIQSAEYGREDVNLLDLQLIDDMSYRIMDEQEYHDTVEVNCYPKTDFCEQYGRKDAKMLVILVCPDDLGILMLDGCTEEEAKKHLENGTTVFDGEDLAEHLEDYMDEWNIPEEDRQEYVDMIEGGEPVEGWSVVEYEHRAFYIAYVL